MKALEIFKNNVILQKNVEPNYLKEAIEELEVKIENINFLNQKVLLLEKQLEKQKAITYGLLKDKQRQSNKVATNIPKEIKALAILKKIKKYEVDTRSQRNNVDINFTIHNFREVNEGIKELETLAKKLKKIE